GGAGRVDRGGPGHGAGVRADLADDAAEGTTGPGGAVLGGDEPGRRARYRDGYRRGGRGGGGRCGQPPEPGHHGGVRRRGGGRGGGAGVLPSPAGYDRLRLAAGYRPRARPGARRGPAVTDQRAGARRRLRGG